MTPSLSVLFLSTALASGSVAMAQTTTLPAAAVPEAPAAGAPGTMDELTAIVRIQSRAKTPTQIPENQPVQVDLSLVEVPDVPKPLLEGVSGNAFARYVEVDKKLVGQMVLAGVSKDGKVEPLDTTRFATQFDLPSTTLSSDTPVVIEGDKVQLIEALKRLQGTEEEDKKEEDGEDKTASLSNGNGSSNTDAAGYTTPTPGTLPEDQPEPEPETTVEVVEDGCKIRIDLGQMVAIQQNKTITVTGGTRTETPCEDGGTRYRLQESFLGCDAKVDRDALTATARKKLFYVDASGTSVQAQDCTEDPEKVYPITEDRDACPIFLDYPKEKAVTQAVLTYTDHRNARVQLPGPCLESVTVPAVPLIRTSDGCTIRHDFQTGRSYQQSRYTYTLNGVQYDAGFCADAETAYPHVRVFDDISGAAICPAVIDHDKKLVARQYRTRITVGGIGQYIDDCTPDSATVRLETTQDGCDDPSTWAHDLSAGVSYESVRDYYLRNGRREYITQCRNGPTAYPHQIAAAGWENHDGTRTALQKSRVTINGPKGEYVIAASTILPGTTALPYSYMGRSVTRTGASTYEGCTAWRETAKADQYKRPDGSTYNLILGAGTAENGGNVCDKVLTSTRNFVVALNRYMTVQPYTEGDGTQRETYMAHHQQVRRDASRFVWRNRENGQDISTVVEWTTTPVTYPQIIRTYDYFRGGELASNIILHSDAWMTVRTQNWAAVSPQTQLLNNALSTVQLTSPPTTGW